jgi:hypothetical protein
MYNQRVADELVEKMLKNYKKIKLVRGGGEVFGEGINESIND